LDQVGIKDIFDIYCIVDVMISKILVGEDIEGSYQEEKMSKFLMKFRLQKNINQQIQKENYEWRM